MSSSTFEIKKFVDPSTLPPQCDFVIPGYNTLIYSRSSDFKLDFLLLQNEFKFACMELDISVVRLKDEFSSDDSDIENNESEPYVWARDFITSKTPKISYVLHKAVDYYDAEDESLVEYNLNINQSTGVNREKLVEFNSKFECEFTNLISAGGNIFHCVNAGGESYALAGERALTSEMRIDCTDSYLEKVKQDYPKTGSKSKNKYEYPSDVEGEYLIETRELSKKILKDQVGKTTKLAMVPNSVEWHIDVEMAALPNGVFLLHSVEETFKLLEKNKEKIPGYAHVCRITQIMAEMAKPHLVKAKRKLEKHGFKVMEVCGFITNKMGHEGIFACGLNSLVGLDSRPGLDKCGNIFYTLPPDNPVWYQEYFKKKLVESGVTKIYYLSNPNTLKILREYDGSIRCQHNTIPNGARLFFSSKGKRKCEDQDGVPNRKRQKTEIKQEALSKR